LPSTPLALLATIAVSVLLLADIARHPLLPPPHPPTLHELEEERNWIWNRRRIGIGVGEELELDSSFMDEDARKTYMCFREALTCGVVDQKADRVGSGCRSYSSLIVPPGTRALW
jgi:hypothetical protein